MGHAFRTARAYVARDYSKAGRRPSTASSRNLFAGHLSISWPVVRRVSRGRCQVLLTTAGRVDAGQVERFRQRIGQARRSSAMRVMVIIKANKDTEAGVMPSEQLLTEMGNFNEELVKAGIMLAGEGLHPSSKGARVRFSGSKRTVIDGPFAETKELDRRLLAVAGEVDGRGASNGSSAAPIRPGRSPRSRFARSSRPTTSAPSSRPSCGSRRSACRAQAAARQRQEVGRARRLPRRQRRWCDR